MIYEPRCPVCGESVADYKGPCPKPTTATPRIAMGEAHGSQEPVKLVFKTEDGQFDASNFGPSAQN